MHQFLRRRRAARESGGFLVVEAALVIPVYLAFVLSVMQLLVIASAQAKVTTAVNTAAVELSQHSYIRSTELGTHVSSLTTLLETFFNGLSAGIGGIDPNSPVLQTTFNSQEAAESMLAKHLDPSDSNLRSMGVVDGAAGVTPTGDTDLFTCGARLVLDVEYEIQIPWLLNYTIPMKAHAETYRWEAAPPRNCS